MQGASQKVFGLKQNGSQTYVNIANGLSGVRLFDVTDPNNVVAIAAVSSSTLNAVVDTGIARKLLATKDFITPTIKRITFREISPSQYDFIIISHPQLRNPALGYSDPVNAYVAYR
ncbi:MAG: hypothetical protein QM762_22670 [Chryseolinea sp.]